MLTILTTATGLKTGFMLLKSPDKRKSGKYELLFHGDLVAFVPVAFRYWKDDHSEEIADSGSVVMNGLVRTLEDYLQHDNIKFHLYLVS